MWDLSILICWAGLVDMVRQGLVPSEFIISSFWLLFILLRYINSYLHYFLLPSGINHSASISFLHLSLHRPISPYYLPFHPILYPTSLKPLLFPAKPYQFLLFSPHPHSHSLPSHCQRPINQTPPQFQIISIAANPCENPSAQQRHSPDIINPGGESISNMPDLYRAAMQIFALIFATQWRTQEKFRDFKCHPDAREFSKICKRSYENCKNRIIFSLLFKKILQT